MFHPPEEQYRLEIYAATPRNVSNDEKVTLKELKGVVTNYEGICQGTAKLLFDEKYSDVEFLVGPEKQSVVGHRQIIGAASDYFEKLLYGDFIESGKRQLEISDVSEGTFRLLLTFIYTGKVEITADNMVPLLGAADRFGVTSARNVLLDSATEFLGKASTCFRSMSQVITLLEASNFYQIDEIQSLALNYVDLYTTELIESDLFLSLGPELMNLIFARDSLKDSLEEVQIYLALLRWARGRGTLNKNDDSQFDVTELSEEATESLKEVLHLVRFPLIPPETIVKHIRPSGLVSTDLLFECLAYHVTPDVEMKNQQLTTPRSGSQLPWRWSPKLMGRHILLEDNFKTAIGTHYDWEKVLGGVDWYGGKHSFEVEIDLDNDISNNTWQIIVGVAHPQTFSSGHLGLREREWGYMCRSGQKIAGPDIREEYSTPSKRGDRIRIEVDMSTGTLTFFKNGVSLGIAFRNIRGPISPCVSLIKDQQVTLLH